MNHYRIFKINIVNINCNEKTLKNIENKNDLTWNSNNGNFCMIMTLLLIKIDITYLL